jgi:hypothetical protein
VRFVDTAIDKIRRFSIGREEESGRYYLAIPVSNRMVDYEERYEIGAELHDGYPANAVLVEEFADRCRRRLNDDLLFAKPGSDRGVAT